MRAQREADAKKRAEEKAARDAERAANGESPGLLDGLQDIPGKLGELTGASPLLVSHHSASTTLHVTGGGQLA